MFTFPCGGSALSVRSQAMDSMGTQPPPQQQTSSPHSQSPSPPPPPPRAHHPHIKLVVPKRASLQTPRTVYSGSTVFSMGDYLCIGDFVSLYCVDTDGYVFSTQSSSVHNGLYIYQEQDREAPKGVPNVHAVTFQVCIQNRYKSNKNCRSLVNKSLRHESDIHLKAQMPQAKKAATAEDNDNIAEQKRQHGKKVRYGEIIQLKHAFTNKYIHVSTTQGSVRDKNNMLVSLHEYNAKHAQFRVQPRYKVKSEGDNVQIYDQIVLESVKSPGQYFHASQVYQIDSATHGSELNLGIERTGFTIMKSYKPTAAEESFIRGGSCVRLFHRELEAYLTTEGLFDDLVLQDVHLRVRQIDQINNPKTLLPSTSGLIYWQIETESSILNGGVILWGQQVRLRHMVTRQYLCLDVDMELALTAEFNCPKTVFRLHPVKKEVDEIKFESYARIEHELTGRWLHALKDDPYIPRDPASRGDAISLSMPMLAKSSERTLSGLRPDEATLCKITSELDQRYDDAFSLQLIEPVNVGVFNYVAGAVPFLKNVIDQLNNNRRLVAADVHKITKALNELRDFLFVNGLPDKPRQKLLRNLRILDLLMALLQFPLKGTRDRIYLTTIFKSSYELLHAYMAGNSRKNALYMAKYIGFFYTQLNQQGDIGLNVAQMVMELIKDNRKVVEKLNEKDIDIFVSLLKKNKNYRYLDMLNVLCVCDGVALPDNQNYIAKKWLTGDKRGLLLLDSGLNIRRETRRDISYISNDGGLSWLLLHEFCNRDRPEFAEEDYQFLLHQLDLLGKLCHGGNDYAIQTITEQLKLVTWEQAFYCLRHEELPEDLRAQYCSLIIGLFVNSGVTRATTDHISLAFVYEDVGRMGSIKRILDTLNTQKKYNFDELREWITAFLEENGCLVANRPTHNLLIAQILRLVLYLVEFGYYGSTADIRRLLKPLLNLLDGRHDRPVQEQTGHFDKNTDQLIKHYQTTGRFEKSPETSAIVAVKLQAMEILDLLFTFQYHSTLEGFIAAFKNVELKGRVKRIFSVLSPMLTETFDASKETIVCRRALKKLDDLFEKASFFDKQQITGILMDLSYYKYDKMVTNSMSLLNKYYSAKADLFKRAVFSQVLITEESVRVHKRAQENIPSLRRLMKSRLNEEQAKRVGGIFEQLAEFCHMVDKKDKPHPMNQTILINHGILSVIFDLLAQHCDADLKTRPPETRTVVRKSLRVLMFLSNGNEHVRKRVYERLDVLMSLRGVEQEVALCLKIAFQGSESLCLKIHPYMIERMVKLAAEQREKAPAVLELLRALVKVPDLDLPLKRNQMYVMKYIMHNFHKAAYAIDQNRDVKEKILTMKYGAAHLRYMIVLVDLLATCAEGENRFIESLCQKFVKLEDVFWVLNHAEIDNNLKSPFLKYLLWVYMNTAGSMVESGAAELPHEAGTWEYLSQLVNDVNQMTVFSVEHKDLIEMLLTKAPSISQVADSENPAEMIRSNLHYIFDGVMPFLQVFFRKFYTVDKELYPDEAPIVDKLAHSLMVFSEAIGFLIHNPKQMRTLVSCALSVVPQSSLPSRVLEEFLEKFGTGHLDLRDAGDEEAYREYSNYYREEEELNAKLHTFAANFRMVYGGENTVGAQLKHVPLGARRRVYTEVGGDEELPLGEEFQDFIDCFITAHAKTAVDKYEKADILLDQLVISFSRSRNTEEKRLDQEDLDIKCLQLLRGMIHNEERRIAQNWSKNSDRAKSQLAHIADLQSAFNAKEALWKVLPHVARQNDFLVKEVLSFISAMLFNANRQSQWSMRKYFLSTREENFFFAIKTRMHMSATAAKEKRALISQHKAKNKEAETHAKSLQVTMTQGRIALQRLQTAENARRMIRLRRTVCATEPTSIFQKTPAPAKVRPTAADQKPKSIFSNLFAKEKQSDPKHLSINGRSGDIIEEDTREDMELMELKVDDSKSSASSSDSGEMCGEPDGVDLQYKDDGYIELVLKVLARMCDGQYTELQDYLREQPDNIKSFNLIAETVQYLSQHYANINASSINLVIQLLDCLNECIVGNDENRAVIFDNKIVDYVNFILRTGQFKYCTMEKALQLLEIIGNLLMSLIEENSPAALEIAREIADCLDKDALRRLLAECYHLSREPETGHFAAARKLAKSAGSSALAQTKKLSQRVRLAGTGNDDDVIVGTKSVLPETEGPLDVETATTMLDVGFKYYYLYCRLLDIAPKLAEKKMLEAEQLVHAFYEKNSMSVELLKDGHLQKVRFRVENKNVLRKEVKEKLKWEVDRSSPSSKIRDLMAWSRDILSDITYQRKVLNNKLAFFFMKFWLFWNYGAIVMSLAINILMLSTWEARLSMSAELAANSTLPAELYDFHPKIAFEDYQVVKYSFSGVHNFLSVCVLISYFLLNHPRLPKIQRPCRPMDDQFAPVKEIKKPSESKLETHFLSFKTFYYVLFVAFSVLGTVFTEYLFCFHLLNIVNNNQLLARVIKAVTTNGKSLLWVGVLGVVIFYIYALIAFAFMRSSFNSAHNWYCSNLFECFITIIRYGLIGDMFENLAIHEADSYFARFGVYVIFNVSFFIFITTIGLNIIFGIIVDTFSELRDLKWTAEKDMRDACFICSRSSYDFEHYGKGFLYHVRNEHNMWAYIFFFIHLNDTKPTDYSAIELHVYKSLNRQNYDFYPINRALCLQDTESSKEETQYDELLHYVSSIFNKQKEEELRKKHDEERKKQQKWEEENRRLVYGDENSVMGTLGRSPMQQAMVGLQQSTAKTTESELGLRLPSLPGMEPRSPQIMVRYSQPGDDDDDDALTDPFNDDDYQPSLTGSTAALDREFDDADSVSLTETASLRQAAEAITASDTEDIPTGQVTKL